MECLSCAGNGCRQCGDSGRLELTGCPTAYASEAFEWIHYARMYEKGIPLVDGGSLSQPAKFNALCQIIWSEQAYWRNKIGALDG
jgi:hypothetical protein